MAAIQARTAAGAHRPAWRGNEYIVSAENESGGGDKGRRKLAAIFSADVVGYSRLMGDDDEATLRTLGDYRAAMKERITRHNGRVVDSTGDALLAEFSSAVEAIDSACEIQHEFRRRNSQLADHRKMEFRIGINLGEVIEKEGALYGDGVNVAARLESMSDPGGICISSSVHEQVEGKVGVHFEDTGEHEVKNISRPVHAFRVVPVMMGEATPQTHDLPVKPSIAILPFDNMSGDEEQEYFADGITEDIITQLSRFSNLFVIARNSTFVYKGKATKIQDVAKDLNVHYVVEGSVRRAGKRVRVTVQLIDAATGNHIWAEKYDRDLEDVFDLQDELSQAIVAILPGRMEAADIERINRKPPQNMAAYDYVMRGKIHHHRATRKDNALSLEYLEKAIELDPDYAAAHAWKACVIGQAWSRNFRPDAEELMLGPGEAHLKKAYELDPDDPECHRVLAAMALIRGQFDDMRFHQERGLALNPNYDLIVVQQGELLTWTGAPDEAVEWIERAMKLNPYHPERFWSHLGRALFVGGHYERAIDALRKLSAPDAGQHAFMAAAYAAIGNAAKASHHAAEARRIEADFTVETYVRALPFRDDGDRDRLREHFIAAGLG